MKMTKWAKITISKMLVLAVLLSSNLPGAFAQQRSIPREDKKAPDTEKGLKLVKGITPWTAARIKLIKDMTGSGKLPGVTAMALSPNGKLLAWGDRESNVFLWFSQEDRLVVVKDTNVSKPPRDKKEAANENYRKLKKQATEKEIECDNMDTFAF